MNDRSRDVAHFLLKDGTPSDSHYVILSITSELVTSFRPIKSSVELSGARLGGLIAFTPNDSSQSNFMSGTVSAWFQSPYQVHLSTLGNSESAADGDINLKPDGDPAGFLLESFTDRHATYSFLQTGNDLLEVQVGSGSHSSSHYSLFRSQLIPNEIYASLYRPLLVQDTHDEKGETSLRPGFFVDATLLDLDTAYVVVAGADGLYAPIEHNYRVPNGCSFANPVVENGISKLPLFCTGTGEIDLSFIDLELK